ncbi:MAG: hypothetical protein Ct9H300mP10_07580 [Methanobacteriota archaeon]|nr:MAG: hypothetical protein Ct9H300mP10_07580 [Euryarchaeota archaeon]
MFGGTYPSAPQSTSFWADRSGCDATWTNLGSIDLTDSDGVAETDDLEHLNCTDGNRVAHWRNNNGIHAPSLNDEEWPSQTLGWSLEDFSRDSDGDGYRDDIDAFIYNPNEWADADGDKVGDNTDECDSDPTGFGLTVMVTGSAYRATSFPTTPTSGTISTGTAQETIRTLTTTMTG